MDLATFSQVDFYISGLVTHRNSLRRLTGELGVQVLNRRLESTFNLGLNNCFNDFEGVNFAALGEA